jgi:histone-lysine N-methyltransferase SUV420H
LFAFFSSSDPFFLSTILRYKLLYSPESNVQLEKVVFGDGPISGGLRARSTIRAGAYLLHACGSLSSNLHKPGHATIEATTQQLGPTGSRLILGPLRFVNHDCNPNSQVSCDPTLRVRTIAHATIGGQLYPIPNSNAFTIITLRQIEAGDSITVKYTEGGYWGECWCGTCKGYSTLVLPRRENKDVPNPNKKQRRGGKRKTVSLDGVHVRVANNRGRLNIAPEHVPPNFVLPAPVLRRSKKAAVADADAPIPTTEVAAADSDMPAPTPPAPPPTVE